MSWERLNAYVDGELAPADAAEVAAAIARAPDLAARVATLSRLKAMTGHLVPPDAPLPIPICASRRTWKRLLPLAAAVVVLVATAAALWFGSPEPRSRHAWLDEPLAAHRAWLEQEPGSGLANRLGVALGAVGTVRVPDLSDARLSLVRVSLVPAEDGAASLFLGYRGVHGCRVGLWIGAALPGLDDSPVRVEPAGASVHAWNVAATGYVILASGMDEERLRRLVHAVARIVRQEHRLDEGIRTALRGTVGIGHSCVA